MDGKLYVIWGIREPESKLLACAEEYDLATGTWTEIPNMPLMQPNATKSDIPPVSQAHPLVAFLNNQLYVADYDAMENWKHDKES